MMKRFSVLMLAALLILTGSVGFAADGSSNIYQGYTFDFFGNIKSTPSAFTLSQVLTGGVVIRTNSKGQTSETPFPFSTVSDVCTASDGRIFIADGNLDTGRVYIFNPDGTMATVYDANGDELTGINPVNTIKALNDKGRAANVKIDEKGNISDKGATTSLKGCEGVFFHEKANELYIADTVNQRIVVLDGDTYLYKRMIYRPENMTGDTEFKPAKIAVDNADRIYVVVKSSYEGIIELNEDGTFSRYFGVNEPSINLLDFFWKSIASDAQKEKMTKTYAPAFNNVALDGEGFIMAVTSDSAANKSVFRLNFAGANVLREMGNTPVVGDLRTDKTSAFTDIAVKRYGTYAVLDKTNGRIFLYNFDGELLSVFGTLGTMDGQFRTPTGIAWLGDKLVVTDSGLKCAYIFEPTEFGQALLNACEDYYDGNWEDATAHFEEVLRLCGNLETAYTGIGKNKLMQEEYEEAMRCFKLGNNREFYSKAYKGYRTIVMKENFGIIAVIAVIAIGAVLWSEVAYHRKQRRLYK